MKPRGHGEQTLTLLIMPSPLESKQRDHLSGQVSSSKMADQINKPGFQSWNINQEQKKHFNSEQSENSPGQDRLGFFIFIFFYTIKT